MERIELFERYIFGQLTPQEQSDFDLRLKSDKDFASDFKIYIFSLKGILQEGEQEDAELAYALKNISKEQLCEAIGKNRRRKSFRVRLLRERMAWISSIAAIVIVGMFTIIQLERSSRNKLYDTIVAYNYIPSYDRSEGDINNYSSKEIGELLPILEKDYRNAPADDVQAAQDAGMRLAMAYLKLHDKKKAVETLRELAERFRDDEEFAARCNKIISQLE